MRYAFVLSIAALLSCTGMTLGENEPGADTYMDDGRPPSWWDDEPAEPDDPDDPATPDDPGGPAQCFFNGSIAVDDRTERIFVLQSSAQTRCADWSWDSEPVKVLYALDPDGRRTDAVVDLTGHDDIRLVFPKDKVLVMFEEGDRDNLLFLDATTLNPVELIDAHAHYHGTRLSASRRYIAVAANERDDAPIHVIDSATAHIREIPHGGDWLEAMWLNRSDRLIAIAFRDIWTHPSARILGWTFDGTRSLAEMEVDDEGVWARRDLDLVVHGADPDFFFSFTWVGIAPDDTYAVFPVVLDRDGCRDHTLLVIDLTSGDLRTVDDAHGPVGFTPDGSTIVSYRYLPYGPGGEESHPALLLVDAETLEEQVVPVDVDGGPHYFVTREGNFVVVASNWSADGLILYDIDNDQTTELGGTNMGLHEFVSRLGAGELWLLSSRRLFRLNLYDAVMEEIPLSFGPAHINILRRRDELVLDDPGANRLLLFDPDNLRIEHVLPLPTDYPSAFSFGTPSS